jgi:hypothetical protein
MENEAIQDLLSGQVSFSPLKVAEKSLDFSTSESHYNNAKFCK